MTIQKLAVFGKLDLHILVSKANLSKAKAESFKKWEVNGIKPHFENGKQLFQCFCKASNIETNLQLEFLPTDNWLINNYAWGAKV